MNSLANNTCFAIVALAVLMTTPASAQERYQQRLVIPAPSQVTTPTYFSPSLKGRFYLRTFQYHGQLFMGARIVSLEPNSPLHHLQLRPNDVITRLDSIPIGKGTFKRQCHITGLDFWMIPQMEKHYGRTLVRYYRAGTGHMLIEEHPIDLGPQHAVTTGYPPHIPGGLAP